jgi:hypothetical protein
MLGPVPRLRHVAAGYRRAVSSTLALGVGAPSVTSILLGYDHTMPVSCSGQRTEFCPFGHELGPGRVQIMIFGLPRRYSNGCSSQNAPRRPHPTARALTGDTKTLNDHAATSYGIDGHSASDSWVCHFRARSSRP